VTDLNNIQESIQRRRRDEWRIGPHSVPTSVDYSSQMRNSPSKSEVDPLIVKSSSDDELSDNFKLDSGTKSKAEVVRPKNVINLQHIME